jgi:DNA replication and repair protein RecF
VLIKKIELINFRNLKNQVVLPGELNNVLYGENAQGKTNFIEAVYLISCLKSFHANRSNEMIAFGQSEAMVRAEIIKDNKERELKVIIREKEKRAFIDGKAAKSVAGYLGTLNAVLFLPDDLQIPRGAPSERRNLLDRAIYAAWPGYLELVRSYQKVLHSRNHVLRQKAARFREMIDIYDQQLAEYGSKIIAGRLRYLRALKGRFEQCFAEVSQESAPGTLQYFSRVGIERKEEAIGTIYHGLIRQLEIGRAEDVKRQMTMVGPHSDDLDFQIEGKSTRSYGSQGQKRTIILAFKIAQILENYERVGAVPVLLLDDVSSELDERRNEFLFKLLKKIPCQIFLTTTRADLIPDREKNKYLQVVEGSIRL